MKTLDEIKKGLEHCAVGNCGCECPYFTQIDLPFGDEQGCDDSLLPDALAYIQQLETERDAAVSDLKKHVGCAVCKHYKTGAHGICLECYRDNELFEWRGIGGA